MTTRTPCQACKRPSPHGSLCSACSSELRDMLQGLAYGQPLPSGHRGAGFIEYLEDAALGRTRLGESARRSSERNTPLPVHLGASAMLREVTEKLGGWVHHFVEKGWK